MEQGAKAEGLRHQGAGNDAQTIKLAICSLFSYLNQYSNVIINFEFIHVRT